MYVNADVYCRYIMKVDMMYHLLLHSLRLVKVMQRICFSVIDTFH